MPSPSTRMAVDLCEALFGVSRRRTATQMEYICPLCQLTIRPNDLQSHLKLELSKIQKICYKNKKKFSSTSSSASVASASDDPLASFSILRAKKNFRDEASFEAYKNVKINRLCRVQNNYWKSKETGENSTCPLCLEMIPATSPGELQVHVENCLKQEDESEEEVEGDEYEWCGMRRVRITSLMRSRGQLEALGTKVTQGNEDENVDVCFDEDEETKIGPPQYHQQDLVYHLNASVESNEEPNSMDASNISDQSLLEDKDSTNHRSPASTCTSSTANSTVLEALRDKIQDMEQKGTFICHICRGPYETPLVSTVCWHVHCETCWLRTLSSQKLCPQCKVIVSPTDLRKIYL